MQQKQNPRGINLLSRLAYLFIIITVSAASVADTPVRFSPFGRDFVHAINQTDAQQKLGLTAGSIGDITGVTAGTNLTGGGTSGTVTLNLANPITVNVTGNLTGNVTGNVTGNLTGNVTGNADTATALAANGTNCSAGNYPLGIDASGNVESCTAVSSTIVLSAVGTSPNANGATASGMNLNLEPASASFPGVVSDTTQTFAGTKSGVFKATGNWLLNGNWLSNDGDSEGLFIDTSGTAYFSGTAILQGTGNTAWTIKGQTNVGTNVSGGRLQLYGGKGTGTGANGTVDLWVPALEASGTTAQNTVTLALRASPVSSTTTKVAVTHTLWSPEICDETGSNCWDVSTTVGSKTHQIDCLIQNGGSVITTGLVPGCVYRVPWNCTPTKWEVASVDAASPISGAIQIDVFQDTYANLIPDVSDTIAGSEKIIITASGTKATDTSLSTWTAFSAGKWIAFSVDSVSSFTAVRAVVECTE